MIAPRGISRQGRDDAPVWTRGGTAELAPPDRTLRERDSKPQATNEVSATRRFWLRVLFALDVVGAGGPGVLMLAAPDKAGDLLFGGDLVASPATAVLGCIWVALGVLSLAGLARPVTFSPVLLVQFVYKLVWLAAVGLPAVLSGDSVPPVATAVFAGWVVAVGFAAPWGVLFGADDGCVETLVWKPR